MLTVGMESVQHVKQIFNKMAIQVTIESLTGTSPYDVYICDDSLSGCVYISTISSAPYIFDVPAPLDVQTELCVKVIDTNGCEITQCGTV